MHINCACVTTSISAHWRLFRRSAIPASCWHASLEDAPRGFVVEGLPGCLGKLPPVRTVSESPDGAIFADYLVRTYGAQTMQLLGEVATAQDRKIDELALALELEAF
jgi:hypothetical protein